MRLLRKRGRVHDDIRLQAGCCLLVALDGMLPQAVVKVLQNSVLSGNRHRFSHGIGRECTSRASKCDAWLESSSAAFEQG